MIIKTLEVSLSKEERRIVDEHGNTASTWARIGFDELLCPGIPLLWHTLRGPNYFD